MLKYIMFAALFASAAAVLGLNTTAPTSAAPTTQAPTSAAPTTQAPTTAAPTTQSPTTAAPTTQSPTTAAPTTQSPTSAAPTTQSPTAPTSAPTHTPTTRPTTGAPTSAPTHTPTTQPTTGAPTHAGNVLDAVKKNPDLSKFLEAVGKFADIENELNGTGSLVVFAPVNAAFGTSITATEEILKYHVITDGEKLDLKEGLNPVKSSDNDQILKIVKTGDDITVTFGVPSVTAEVSATVETDNGVLHLVNKVLLPPAATGTVEKAAGVELFGAIAAKTLAGKTGVTIFATQDVAFKQSKVDTFGEQAQRATALYSVVQGCVFSNDIPDGTTEVASLFGANLTTVGANLTIVKTIEGVTVNGVKVTATDILTSTDVIHTLESVLVVPWNAKQSMSANFNAIGAFTELTKAAARSTEASSFLAGADPKVFFAPSTAALKAANATGIPVASLTELLLYHFVDGKHNSTQLTGKEHWNSKLPDSKLGADAVQVVIVDGDRDGQTVNGVSVTGVFGSVDGFVYELDGVLDIPGTFNGEASDLGLLTFLALLNRTDLKLDGDHLTIFAPDDDAFTAYLKEHDIADAKSMDVKAAKKLLLEHVYDKEGVVYAKELFSLKNLTMDSVTWDIKDNTIGGAIVKDANNLVINGVFHVIDRVLGGPKPADPAKKEGMNGGVVVAIVVGALAGVAIIGYCCFRSSKREDEDYQAI